MQTITFNDSNISSYIFEDNATITVSTDSITCPGFIICDMNSGNATVTQNVTPPADWKGGKYVFDGTNWIDNPIWNDPQELEIARLEEELAALKP
jgi:hypothetical protein